MGEDVFRDIIGGYLAANGPVQTLLVAITIAAIVALWRAWGEERKARFSDAKSHGDEIKGLNVQINDALKQSIDRELASERRIDEMVVVLKATLARLER